MKLTEKDVRYVANLANLALSDEELDRMLHDLSGILVQMDRLSEIDTEGIEPMQQVLFAGAESSGLREDLERPPLGNELAVANAPLASGGYFKVPKVIER